MSCFSQHSQAVVSEHSVTMLSLDFQNRKSPIRFEIHMNIIEEAIQDH